MKIVIPAESRPGEKRVAMVPSVVKKFTTLGLDVVVESGAGTAAFAPDATYVEAGAHVAEGAAFDSELASADVVASVRPLDPERVRRMRRGGVTISFLSPGSDTDTIAAMRQAMKCEREIGRLRSTSAVPASISSVATRAPQVTPTAMKMSGSVAEKSSVERYPTALV